MGSSATVLIVDDDQSIRQTMEAIVRAAGIGSIAVDSGEEALKVLKKQTVNVMLLDVQMPGMSGLDVLRTVREQHPDVGVIMLSVIKELPVAIEAMRLGALDYVTKDFSPSELSARISKTLDQLKASRELVFYKEEAARGVRPMIRGNSPRMREVLAVADKVSNTPVTVLLTGESGTGKEVLARYLHEHSDRRSRPFVAVNLAALPEHLIESTLFGHEKGSFTGATRQAFGKFELASGGTLFLDELGELKMDVQAKLLRALQEREIERVGGERPIQVDLRVVCATNRNLEKEVRDGRFREDLYWRLKVVPIEMPPLRERRNDIRELAEHFLARYCALNGSPQKRLADSAAAVLEAYSWPGNIRELENEMQRMVLMSSSDVIEESDLSLELAVAAGLAQEAEKEKTLQAAVQAFERGYLRKALAKNKWHKRSTAENLGIGYSTLKVKLKQYGIAHDDSDD
jgi:DNA-binding NtrC family response regulator